MFCEKRCMVACKMFCDAWSHWCQSNETQACNHATFSQNIGFILFLCLLVQLHKHGHIHFLLQSFQFNAVGYVSFPISSGHTKIEFKIAIFYKANTKPRLAFILETCSTTLKDWLCRLILRRLIPCNTLLWRWNERKTAWSASNQPTT